VGEFMVIMGTIVSVVLDKQAQSQAVVAALGVILAAVYMLHVVQRMFFGPLDNPKNRDVSDLNVRESLSLAPLVALIFVIGLFPNIFLSQMNESVTAVVDRFVDGKVQYDKNADAVDPVLRAKRGGPLERGHPEPPGEGEDEAEKKDEVALKVEDR
jgi:NADH-quinone oxidoreductase subunit M